MKKKTKKPVATGTKLADEVKGSGILKYFIDSIGICDNRI